MNEQIIAPGLVESSAKQPMSMQVTVFNDQSVLHLSEPREYVAMSGQESLMLGARLLVAGVEADKGVAQAAIAAALAVVDAVYELRADIKPAGGAAKHELIERHRKTLSQRLSIVLNSEREKRAVSNAKLSRQIVDICLNEVFA